MNFKPLTNYSITSFDKGLALRLLVGFWFACSSYSASASPDLCPREYLGQWGNLYYYFGALSKAKPDSDDTYLIASEKVRFADTKCGDVVAVNCPCDSDILRESDETDGIVVWLRNGGLADYIPAYDGKSRPGNANSGGGSVGGPGQFFKGQADTKVTSDQELEVQDSKGTTRLVRTLTIEVQLAVVQEIPCPG